MPCGTGQRGSGVGMDLKRLEYFCAIVEKGQISKAAEALHISQPPLSMRLKELEEELDVQLIYREGKAWQVTPEGEALYQRAQFILSYVAGLEKDIRESRNKVSGLVSTSRNAWFTNRRAMEVSGRTTLTTREENAASFSKTS